MLMVPTQQGLIELALASTLLGTSSVPFMNGAKLKLINSSTVTLNSSTTWGSCSANISGFAGYADGSMSFTAPYTPDAGGIASASNVAVFRPTGSDTTQQGWGLILTDSGSSSVMFAAPFDDPPIPFTSALDQLQVTLVFNPASPGMTPVLVS